MTAFASVVMILSNLVPAGLYTFPAAAGILIFILSFAAGKSYGWASFLLVAIISFFFCANKETSLCFILFLGYYPLVREQIEKLRFRAAAFLIKLLLFNAAAVLTGLLLMFVFSVPADHFELFGISIPGILLALLNGIFLLYDYAIALFLRAYRKKIDKFVTKMNKKF